MKIEGVLAEGKPNSSGRVQEVIDLVLKNQTKLPELFECLFSQDENVRLRAGDALEKICREHAEWLTPYVPRLLREVTTIEQHSVQWHLAQMLANLELSTAQQKQAVTWLEARLQDPEVDWIVAGYSMETLAQFTREGNFEVQKLQLLLKKQQKHHSKAVVKRATKLLAQLNV